MSQSAIFRKVFPYRGGWGVRGRGLGRAGEQANRQAADPHLRFPIPPSDFPLPLKSQIPNLKSQIPPPFHCPLSTVLCPLLLPTSPFRLPPSLPHYPLLLPLSLSLTPGRLGAESARGRGASGSTSRSKPGEDRLPLKEAPKEIAPLCGPRKKGDRPRSPVSSEASQNSRGASGAAALPFQIFPSRENAVVRSLSLRATND